jgi:hypothetical protein
MSRRSTAAVAVALMLVLAGCSIGYPTGGPAETEPPTPSAPPDPPEDGHLGYYDGYWYNQSLAVNETDGLNETEQNAVFSRAMARVQLLRGLEFKEDVEIELVTREQFREEYDDVVTPPPEGAARTLDNAQFEALFLVNSSKDVVEVRRGNRGDLVLGFYQPSKKSITIVSEKRPPALPNERTLAHELVHALQDQRFDLGSMRQGKTLDAANARNGLVEGDAGLVEYEYQRNCASGEWQCVGVREEAAPAKPREGFHYGVYFVEFFPYAEGPSFVEYYRDRDGWDAVNAMYDDPPNNTAEVIYPSTYGTDAYGLATVDDRNGDDWERVRSERGDYASVGQAGLASMFAYTVYTEDGSGQSVVDASGFENVNEAGRLDKKRPFTYDLAYADGWYADRLHAYENDGETALVWNVTFQNETEAAEFHDGYEAVIEFWGGQEAGVRGEGTVWTLDGGRFQGAVWVERDGASVTVVKAPDASDLGDVYGPAG